jgi:hypothetical protein
VSKVISKFWPLAFVAVILFGVSNLRAHPDWRPKMPRVMWDEPAPVVVCPQAQPAPSATPQPVPSPTSGKAKTKPPARHTAS